jgi:MFS family permease
MSAKKIFNRDFILLFFSQFAIASVFHVYIPTLPIYLLRKGCSEVEIGVLIGTLGLSSLIFRPFVGKSLEKASERKFMLGGAVLFGLTSAAYLIASPFWPFLAVRIFQGIGLAFFYTASLTLVARISPEAQRGQSLGYYLLSINIAFALAPTIGMFLVNRFSFDLLFLACTGLSLCSLLIASKIGEVKSDVLEDPSSRGESFFNWRALPPAMMVLLGHMIWGSLTAFFPLFALTRGVSNPGFFFAVYATIMILGRAFGGKLLDRYSREKVLLPCLITYIVSMVIMAFSRTMPMFIVVAVIWGAGNAFFIPTLMALTLDLAGASRGPAVALFSAMGDLGTGLGPVIMGIVLRLTDYPTMFLSVAFVAFINFSYFFLFVRNKKGTRLRPV